MSGKKLLILLLAGLAVLTGLLFLFKGADAWQFWNIPTLEPPFADARILTASSESYALGYDPEINNPRDPLDRPFNLPSIWKLIFLTGINQSFTAALAGFFIACFFLALILFPARLSLPAAVLSALAAFSPPVMLAIERGNVDLFVFFICALALVTMERKWVLSSALMGFAVLLKIYPLFGLSSFLGMERTRFYKFATAMTIAFLIYAALTFNNFRHIFSNTEKGFTVSYGAAVLPLFIGQLTQSRTLMAAAVVGAYLLVFLILAACLYFVDRCNELLPVEETASLAAFRLGAGIYLGTFLLGNNWDYRLIFLLFTLPQLVEWARHSRMAGYTLSAVLLSFAYFWFRNISPAYFLDELANWFVFTGLIYLFLSSAPDWIKTEIHAFFHKMALR